MKRQRLSFILLSLLLMVSIVGLLSVKGLAQTDLNYTFDNDVIVSQDFPAINSSFNMRNRTEYTGNYPATYSFTDEISGTSGTDIDFIDAASIPTDTTLTIESESLGHNKILQLFDDSNSANMFGYANFEDTTYGSIEFWLKSSDATKDATIQIREVGNIMFYFKIDADKFQYYDGDWNDVGLSAIDNTWYHIRFDIECTIGTYQGLAQYRWQIYINGIQYGPYVFANDQPYFSRIYFVTDVGDNGYYFDIDAIGYSWIEDFDGDNIIPLTNNLEILEVDKYEFTYEGPNNFYEVSDTPIGWNKIDEGEVGIITIGGRDLDRNKELYFFAVGLGVLGIEKTTFNLDGEIFDISLDIVFLQWDNGNDDNSFTIKSKDGTVIYVLDIENSGTLNYWDGDNLIEIDTGLTINVNYTFNFFIDYTSDTCLIKRYDDGIYETSYFTPLAETGKQGLDEIIFELYTFSEGDISWCLIDSIGVYTNGVSNAVEYGFLSIDLETAKTWDFQNQYLFTINASGFFTVHGSEGYYFGENAGFETAISERIYNNDLDFVNLIEESMNGNGMTNPFLVLYFDETHYFNNLTYLNIDGVRLLQGSNEYRMSFSSANVNIDESYFHVDSSNRLRGICFYDDSNLEYIQANFDIDNVLNENRSLRFRSQFSGQYGFFSLSYIDLTSSSFDLPISMTSHNLILSQAKTIDEFVFLITDDDELEAGYGSGFIYEIELTWNPSISITIITISLIMIIIPIIIMIVPTLTLYSRFGKSVIMPVFIFMSIICFAGGLIPAWLFFILMIGAGGFLVLKKGSDE